ncbi:MAG: AAA family ATPase [Planctomycetaceae bacterium]|nr:AAA family ATPase [Planctomycetaceae bacterium]
MSNVKKVFVAATKQDQGKTTVSLGLMAAFNDLCGPAGFIKPVGQRYVEIEALRVDEDVALMRAIFPSGGDLRDMSPVTVGRTFTREYIRNPRPQELMTSIRESFDRMCRTKRSIVIEGTGHAGVGACFDASNADVARLLGAKVILVTEGGVGKPIDEVVLNRSLFSECGVELLGVVLNKVLPDKIDEICSVTGAGLARKGVDLLGAIPFSQTLENPTMAQVLDEVGGELLNGKGSLGNIVQEVIIGAMTAHRALDYMHPGCLLITPGDRDDLILAAVGPLGLDDSDSTVAGLLLTGGISPQKNILSLVQRTSIPVILTEDDSYSAATAVRDLKVKIQPADTEKTVLARQLVRRHLDVQGILDRL